MTDSKNMLDVAALKPDYMGFIFYPLSKRDVTDKIVNLPLHKLPASVNKVAVMVNLPLQQAVEKVEKYGFNLVQLHGNETPEYCRSIRKHTSVIKTFSVKDELPEQIKDYKNEVDFFLLDTYTPAAGGSGKAFNHDILSKSQIPQPWFLAGGISPDRAQSLATSNWHNWHAVDLNSRFETSPGIKDIDQLKLFFNQITNL